MTPCLKDAETGEIVDTEVIRIRRSSFLRKYNRKNGWYVNWNELLKENEIYALVIHGSVNIQGLLAVRPDVWRRHLSHGCVLHRKTIRK